MAAGVTGDCRFPSRCSSDQERDVQRLSMVAGHGEARLDAGTSGSRPARPDANPRVPSERLRAISSAWAEHHATRRRRRFVVLWGHSRGVGIDLVGPVGGCRIDVPDGRSAASFARSRPSGPPAGWHSASSDLLNLGTPCVRLGGHRESPCNRESTTSIDLLGLDSCYMSSVGDRRTSSDAGWASWSLRTGRSSARDGTTASSSAP